MLENLFRKRLSELNSGIPQFLSPTQQEDLEAGILPRRPGRPNPELPGQWPALQPHLLTGNEFSRKLCLLIYEHLAGHGHRRVILMSKVWADTQGASAHTSSPDIPAGNQISQCIPKRWAFLLVPKGFSYPLYSWFSAKLANLFNSQRRPGQEQLGRQGKHGPHLQQTQCVRQSSRLPSLPSKHLPLTDFGAHLFALNVYLYLLLWERKTQRLGMWTDPQNWAACS